MEDTQEQIQRIETKVQQLLKEYHHAQKEILHLQKENNRLSDQLAAQIENAKQLHQKADAFSLSTGSMSGSSKKELEKRINTYLKDIDKCLALLHS